jgi:hypothetical protein
VRDSRRDLIDLSRSAGGILLAAGALVLLSRKTHHSGADGLWRTLIVLVPAILLYMLSLGVLEPPESERGQPWRAVLLVTSIVLFPEGLLALLAWLGAPPNDALWSACVLGVTAVLAGYAAGRARVPYAAFVAALTALVAWLVVWAQIIGDPSTVTVRWLLVAAGALLCGIAAAFARRETIGAREVATAGGLAAVAAGAIGVFVGYFAGITGSLYLGSGIAEESQASQIQTGQLEGVQSFGWDLYLLLISLGLVLVGSRVRSRGLAYVGTFGIGIFTVSAGAQIARVSQGHPPDGGVGGWAIVLIVLGAAGLLAPVALARRRES